MYNIFTQKRSTKLTINIKKRNGRTLNYPGKKITIDHCSLITLKMKKITIKSLQAINFSQIE